MKNCTLAGVFCVLSASSGALAGGSLPFVLVAESNDDRVIALSAVDGSIVDANFLDLASAATSVGYSGGITPIEPMEVGNEIWVSDQVADRIWRFNLDGSFAGQIGVDAAGQGLLDNARGFEVVGDTLYVAQGNDASGIGGASEGVVTIDIPSGMITGSFSDGSDAGDRSFWDVTLVGNELYVTDGDSGNDAIERYALDGTFLGSFATSDGVSDFDFPQQLSERGSNGNLLVGGFSSPSGVYEFETDGDALGIVAGTENLGPRAAFELQNGNVLFSHGIVLNRTNDVPVIEGGDGFFPSFRYINASSVPAPGACALLGVAGAVRRRRRA